jgi:GNAT superfamily N-acetyltransferase
VKSCSVVEKLQITSGGRSDYEQLAWFHYRDSRLGPFAAIFAIKPSRPLAAGIDETKAVGVIVYTMPSPGLELRNAATGNFFAGFDKATRLALVNKNVRCISRVIIEPRFRGLGLASALVRETMPKMEVAIIEAMAVMGIVNPFFERAGMKAFCAAEPARCVQLKEAFGMVGIEEDMLIDAKRLQRRLDRLTGPGADFIEQQIKEFLQSYGKRRYMQPGLERMRFVLSKLTTRPVYYIWFNEQTAVSV